MRRDSRLSATLHALLHMAEHDKPMTSAELALCMHTNPVVVRRTMAGLRRVGFVRSEKGHGGGWEICCDLSSITLRDIHEALGSPALLAVGIHLESPACLVEQAVNRRLTGAFADAEALLIERLGNVTLADLSADFHAGMAGRHSRDHHRV